MQNIGNGSCILYISTQIILKINVSLNSNIYKGFLFHTDCFFFFGLHLGKKYKYKKHKSMSSV